MAMHADASERILRQALEASGQRFTEQRSAVFRFLSSTDVHPSADEVFLAVRKHLPGISLATVYKSLETLVGCGLAVKLTYSDGSARYDGRTDPHRRPGASPRGSHGRVQGYRIQAGAVRILPLLCPSRHRYRLNQVAAQAPRWSG
ncbi:MAG: transcriptional repressor [Gemmatimonadota bacterium]